MLAASYNYRIVWGDCDPAGIVFYPNFYKWFDLGTHDLMRLAGHPVRSLRAKGFDIPLLESGCRYFLPGFYEDLVRVETAVAEVRAKSFRLEHRCVRDDVTLCEGFEWRAYTNIRNPDALHAVAIPEELSRALRAEALPASKV